MASPCFQLSRMRTKVISWLNFGRSSRYKFEKVEHGRTRTSSGSRQPYFQSPKQLGSNTPVATPRIRAVNRENGRHHDEAAFRSPGVSTHLLQVGNRSTRCAHSPLSRFPSAKAANEQNGGRQQACKRLQRRDGVNSFCSSDMQSYTRERIRSRIRRNKQ